MSSRSTFLLLVFSFIIMGINAVKKKNRTHVVFNHSEKTLQCTYKSAGQHHKKRTTISSGDYAVLFVLKRHSSDYAPTDDNSKSSIEIKSIING